MTEPCDLSAVEARRMIGARRLSPVELLESCLGRIGRVNHAVNAMVALDTDRARAAAKAAEAAVTSGRPLGPLHGLPVGIKDLEETAGLRTTFGSPLFADHVPAKDQAMVG
jgi:Asp-tRNA(Asn)/Glu-tRNA(Gln) amidotransferase A subunit family amidase